MGAKQSANKKEVVAEKDIKVRGHQYEEIDDDELIENQKKIKEKPSPPSNSEACSGIAQGGANGSTTATLQTAATNSPQINKRYHPYEEIPDDKFSSNQKSAVNEKGDVISKKKQKSKDMFGGNRKEKKKKNAKKNPELVTDESTSEAASVEPVCAETNSLDHVYCVVAKNQVKTGIDGKITTTEDTHKIKDEFNKQEGGTQCKATLVVNEKILIDNAAGRISPVRKPKAAPRFHTYTEVSDSHLKSNKEAQQINSAAGYKLSTGTQSPNLSSRNYTSKVQQDTVVSNGGVSLYSNGDNCYKGCIEIAGTDENDVLDNSEPVEYQNVAAVSCYSPGDHGDQQNGQDNLKDVYAVPQKKKANPRSPKPLNYIEVEFNPSAPRAKASQPQTPTNYCNAIAKDGKIVLLES